MKCADCGGTLRQIDSWDGDRSFDIYQCQDCGEVGGHATGADLPDADWGCVERVVADGGRVGEVR